jgi:hypothetical protein
MRTWFLGDIATGERPQRGRPDDVGLPWRRREITCEPGEMVMGQLIDEIITLLALGDTRHPGE